MHDEITAILIFLTWLNNIKCKHTEFNFPTLSLRLSNKFTFPFWILWKKLTTTSSPATTLNLIKSLKGYICIQFSKWKWLLYEWQMSGRKIDLKCQRFFSFFSKFSPTYNSYTHATSTCVLCSIDKRWFSTNNFQITLTIIFKLSK